MTASSEIRIRLNALATALRHFHSALLDVARSEHEFREGRVSGPFALYSLVMNHPGFQWLRPLSGLMATLDEVTDSKADLSVNNVQDVTQALNMLMHGNDPQFADFRSGYARARGDAKVAATEARWREALAAAQPEGRRGTTPGSLEA